MQYACSDESIISDSSAQLVFSSDTITFDTVFTSIGSATRSFRAINPHSESIVISAIELGNETANFRLNIDGTPTNSARELTILPNDSLWIFVEVTVDPDMPLSISPFVITEEVNFVTNGNEQSVTLEAWGQNANYIPNRESGGEFTRISCQGDSLRFDDPKPYVLYGILIIDSCQVVFPPGAEIYVHGGIARNDDAIFNDGLVVITEHSSLNSRGTLDQPVTIQGDRLESAFSDVSGQWSGIRFLAGSRGNRIKHTHIKNSLVGVRVDSAAFLRIEDSKIQNTAGPGLIGIHSTIIGENLLVTDNNTYSALLTYGGNYTFLHSTFANYGSQNAAVHLDNFSCINNDCDLGAIPNKINANFTNCIIMGSSGDEIELQDLFNGEEALEFRFNFNHCIVSVDELLEADAYPNFFDDCENCINVTRDDLLFIDQDVQDYHLDTMSVAIDQGRPLPTVLLDLEGNARDGNTPDIGCYEFQE